MANVAAAAGRFVVRHGPTLVVKYGPTLAKAVRGLQDYMEEHPAVPRWVAQRAADISKQVSVVRNRRGDAAQALGMIDIIRTQALSPSLSGDVTEWIKRADNIELRIGFAEKLSSPLQKTTLAGLRQESEALLAEFIGALKYVPGR